MCDPSLGNMLQTGPLVLAIASGVISHLTIFVQGEWHLWTGTILCTYLSVAFLMFSIQIHLFALRLCEAAISTLELGTAHIIALFSSIVIYRIFFHRLRKFRGPFWASVTKFWHVWKCRTSQNHLVLDDLRKQYGNIVRTGKKRRSIVTAVAIVVDKRAGPNELTIFDPSAPMVFNEGFNNPCTRSAWYDFLYPLQALISIREKKRHIARHRIWDRGFSISGQ